MKMRELVRRISIPLYVMVIAGSTSCAPRILFKNFCGSGSVRYSVSSSEGREDGWNCVREFGTRSTESGFHISMDLGRGNPGRFAIYGNSTGVPIREGGLHLGLLQLPGERGMWYCATRGALTSEDRVHTARFTSIQKIKFPERASPENRLDLTQDNLEVAVEGALFQTMQFLSLGCNPDHTICSFEYGSELGPYHIYIRTNETPEEKVPIKEAVIVVDDGRSPGRVRLTQVFKPEGSTIWFPPGAKRPEIHLRSFPAFQVCPGDSAQTGELTADWETK